MLWVDPAASTPLSRDEWNLLAISVSPSKDEAIKTAQVRVNLGFSDTWVVKWEMTQGDNLEEAWSERGLPPWISNVPTSNTTRTTYIVAAPQYLYIVVYIKQVSSVWQMFLYSAHSVKNNCWVDVRVLRAQGYATWAIKNLVVYGTSLRDALSFWGLE
jgi:hypothetical protein